MRPEEAVTLNHSVSLTKELPAVHPVAVSLTEEPVLISLGLSDYLSED